MNSWNLIPSFWSRFLIIQKSAQIQEGQNNDAMLISPRLTNFASWPDFASSPHLELPFRLGIQVIKLPAKWQPSRMSAVNQKVPSPPQNSSNPFARQIFPHSFRVCSRPPGKVPENCDAYFRLLCRVRNDVLGLKRPFDYSVLFRENKSKKSWSYFT